MAHVAQNITTIMTDGPAVLAGVKDLAAAELKPAVKAGAVGTGLFGATATVGLAVLRFALLTFAFLFSYLYTVIFDVSYPAGLIFGFATMTLLALAVTVVFALMGSKQFKKVHGPKAALEQLRESILAVTNAAAAGSTEAAAGIHPAAPADATTAAPVVADSAGDEPPANYVTDPLLSNSKSTATTNF
ncbi:MAG: phage holin family protein [Propionibacteriaceae bacterium]|jgi:hypothetical protein|nr:phage holin family protein [Propionibacteriaceae bacterium]